MAQSIKQRAAFLAAARHDAAAAGLAYRPYQAEAAWTCITELRRSSIAINIPQGTGKSFVSQLVAAAYLRQRQTAKVLVVVPSKELREQYTRMASWLGHVTPRLSVISFDESLSGDRVRARVMVDHSHIIVTTPQKFLNRLTALSTESISAIELCILDEFDLWSVTDSEAGGVRFHDAFRILGPLLANQGTRFLGLSATPLSGLGKELLVNELDCREIELEYHPSISEHLPDVRIVPIACHNNDVLTRDHQITHRSRQLLARILASTGLTAFDESHFWSMIKRLAATGDGPQSNAARALLANEHDRLRLYESTTEGLEKQTLSHQLALLRPPSLVFCRERAMVDALASHAWPIHCSVAYSDLGDKYLQSIRRFKDQDSPILLMTRDLGKRGVDFPMAKTLVLLSPKSSWQVMDQELCRTRGQRRKRKDVHVLFFAGTYEEQKTRRVLTHLTALRLYTRYSKFTLPRQWHDWLNLSPGLHLTEYLRGTSA